MSKTDLQSRETLLVEILLSALDARTSAKAASSEMLLYLADLLVHRVREELQEIRTELEGMGEGATNGDAAA